jgi:hypothetical protein
MNHQFSQFDNVLTIRLRGRGDAQELQQALAAHLGKQRAPLTVILDLTLSEGLDQNMKALFYRKSPDGCPHRKRTVGDIWPHQPPNRAYQTHGDAISA